MIVCANCSHENPEAARFCMNCGQPLPQVCPNCGTHNPREARFCFHCGNPLGQAKPAAPSTSRTQASQRIPAELSGKLEADRRAGSMEGERRIVTMLFCDVTGSTAAAGQLDPEEWREVINGAFERMIAPVYRYEGTLARLMGDAILAFFGAPTAHEDDPERAIRAGLDIVRELAPYWEAVEARWGVSANVRVGINTGLVVVGAVGSDLKMEYSALGDAINLAARMEQTAMPGTVQVTEETHRLAAPLFDWQDLGTQEVKGKAQPVRVYRPLKPRSRPGRLRGIEGLDAPLVGRSEELSRLRAAIENLRRGSGGIVFISGEAGLGKSRLISEGRRYWENGDPASGGPPHWIERRATSYETNQAYGLIKIQLRMYCGLEDGAPASQVRMQLSDWAAQIDPEVSSQVRDVFSRALGVQESADASSLDGETFRNQFFAAMDSYFEWLYGRGPGVVVLDDLHWADSASVALIAHLFKCVDALPLLFICASRPDRESPGWSLRAEAEDRFPHRFTRIDLQPLSAADGDSLVNSLLTISDLPGSLRRKIQARAEGNPFFVEEIVRSLIDEGVVRRQGDNWVMQVEIEGIEIPDNVQSLLAARIDRLDEETRRTLQLAAVIGRSFYFRVLKQIAEERQALENHLADLQRSQMILEAARQPELEYMFRHALTQETAYRSILRQQRRVFHSKVAGALETLFPDQLEENAALLAFHFEMAEDPEKALRFYRIAGDAAFSLYANTEAARLYNKALEMAKHAHPDDGDLSHLFNRLGRAHELDGQFDQALKHYEEVEAWAGQTGKTDIELLALVGQAVIRCTPTSLFDFDLGGPLVEKTLALAESLGDQPAIAKIYWIEMHRQRLKGNLQVALGYGEKSLKLCEELGLGIQMAFTLHDMAYVLSETGRVNESIETFGRAADYWRETGNLLMLADNLSGNMINLWLNGDFDGAIQSTDEAFRISQQTKNLWGQAFSQMNIGFAFRERGEYSEALRRVDLSIELGKQSGFPIPEYFGPFQKSIIFSDLGFNEEGLKIAEQVFSYQGNAPFADLHLMGSMARAVNLTYLNRLEEALDIIEKGRAPVSPENSWFFIFFGEIDLMITLRLDKTGKALELSETYLEKAKKYGVASLLGVLYYFHAEAHTNIGNFSQALESLSEASRHAEKLNQRRMIWRILALQSRVAREQGDHRGSQALLEKAQEMLRTITAFVPDEMRASFLAIDEVRAVLEA